MNTKIIETTKEYISGLFHGNSDGHDAEHSLRVYRNALNICKRIDKTCSPDMDIIVFASLLHDVDDHKLFHTENNANARAFLSEQGVNTEDIERIVSVINSVSFSKNRGKTPETIEGMIVQDADRLDALGAVGIARTFAYGGSHGRDLYSSISHFHEKLLLLKDEMNTDAAKTIAEERHLFLLKYLEEYEREVACDE
ncbi:MAG: HD domain-containing protein [Clostridiales bacterium]|nr:HD domain-containing protein [Clostridiales bacterium]